MNVRELIWFYLCGLILPPLAKLKWQFGQGSVARFNPVLFLKHEWEAETKIKMCFNVEFFGA